ncbi:unnamed protein product [Protopolystoma xenopodis]|uniref:Uncharacterized protein n=1 Tax=Protopolystoma xenopodis TaxID=117903 RepID=A0A3S5B4E6_9PLAT|nr:unnamed protein product [Protopolystoma xenopodis]
MRVLRVHVGYRFALLVYRLLSAVHSFLAHSKGHTDGIANAHPLSASDGQFIGWPLEDLYVLDIRSVVNSLYLSLAVFGPGCKNPAALRPCCASVIRPLTGRLISSRLTDLATHPPLAPTLHCRLDQRLPRRLHFLFIPLSSPSTLVCTALLFGPTFQCPGYHDIYRGLTLSFMDFLSLFLTVVLLHILSFTHTHTHSLSPPLSLLVRVCIPTCLLCQPNRAQHILLLPLTRWIKRLMSLHPHRRRPKHPQHPSNPVPRAIIRQASPGLRPDLPLWPGTQSGWLRASALTASLSTRKACISPDVSMKRLRLSGSPHLDCVSICPILHSALSDRLALHLCTAQHLSLSSILSRLFSSG